MKQSGLSRIARTAFETGAPNPYLPQRPTLAAYRAYLIGLLVRAEFNVKNPLAFFLAPSKTGCIFLVAHGMRWEIDFRDSETRPQQRVWQYR